MLTRLLQPAAIGTMLASEPIDFDSLDRLLPFMSSEGHRPAAGCPRRVGE